MNLLDLSQAPHDPAERLLWLSGVKVKAQDELDDAFAETYAQLRREKRFEWALNQKLHGRKRALALTRRWNKTQARMIRWNDGIDRTSSSYDGS